MLRAVLLLASLQRAIGSCIFCDANYSYDLSRLPTTTFTAHSGTRGSTTDPYRRYVVSSPCVTPQSDLCMTHPTSDPLQMRNKQGNVLYTICTGLGTLNATTRVTARGAKGLTVTLHQSRGNEVTNFNLVCDRSAPVTNPPETVVTPYSSGGSTAYNVTWRHPSVCEPAPTAPGECTAPAPQAPPDPVCDGCLPPWKPTWNMSRSTILYGCNSTGPHNTEEAAAYGITVYDWSHAKLQWVNSHPMDDDAELLRQAERVLAVDPGVPGEQPRVWLYRNKIMALNWYGMVREKLDDPQYSGWFVQFKNYKGLASNESYYAPACDWYGDAKSGPPKCSKFYHDQTQSPTKVGAGPAYCRPARDFHNVCRDQCDCGATNPCGEYTFDFRNASFRQWWVNEYMISNQTLLHDPPISPGWLDDGISLNGVSESAPPGTWANDTGMTPLDMQDHQDAFRDAVAELQRAIVDHGGFYWQMIQGRGPKIRTVEQAKLDGTCHEPKPRNVTAEQCAATLREWCTPNPEPWRNAHMYNACPKEMADDDIAREATAEFLLTRGDFAWIGYNWYGCFPMPQRNSTWLRPRPKLWDVDFGGAPGGPCKETGNGTGVFARRYPRADVLWDCNAGTGAINMRVN